MSVSARGGPVETVTGWTRLLAGAFLLHWIWETLHASSYVETSGPLLARALHCLPMAVVDAVWTGALWGAVISFSRGRTKAAARSRLWFVATAGGLTAFILEQYALATNRWRYNALMPIVPVLNVGLWPLLQMIVIPPAVVVLTSFSIRTKAP